jgi:hypothetical protein
MSDTYHMSLKREIRFHIIHLSFLSKFASVGSDLLYTSWRMRKKSS